MLQRLAVLVAHTNEREKMEHLLQSLTGLTSVPIEVFVLDNGCVPEVRLERFLRSFQDLSVSYEMSEEQLSFGAAYNILWRRAKTAGYSWVWMVAGRERVDAAAALKVWRTITRHRSWGLVSRLGLWLSTAGLAAVGGFHEPYFWGVFFVVDVAASLKERGFTVVGQVEREDVPCLMLQHYFAARNPFLFARRHRIHSGNAVRRLFGSIQGGLQGGWREGGWRGMGMAAHGWLDGWKLLIGAG